MNSIPDPRLIIYTASLWPHLRPGLKEICHLMPFAARDWVQALNIIEPDQAVVECVHLCPSLVLDLDWLNDINVVDDIPSDRFGADAIFDAYAKFVVESQSSITWETAYQEWAASNEAAIRTPTYPTPLPRIGQLHPLKPGRLHILASRPGVGKTWLALQWVRELCSAGARTLLFTLEMPPSEIIDRIHVQLDGRPAPDMTSLKVVRAGDDMSPAWFENIVRAHGDWPQVVIVDHLGLLVSEDAQDPIEERKDINSVLRFVRQTKAQSQITYLFLHHITRAGATADKLDLSHLAGSGRIERDADCVLLMTRQTIEVAKARYGRMGIVKATCDTRGMWRENI